MTFIFVFLLSHPDVLARLLHELETAFPGSDDLFNHSVLATLPFLNAVIDESLRLGTPFPGLPRVAPAGGLVLEDVVVPAGTIVGVPAYTQQISEVNFYPTPLEFKPERWLPGGLGPDSRCRRSALMCFSFGKHSYAAAGLLFVSHPYHDTERSTTGPFGCLGRNLAIQEIRIVVSKLLLTFDFQFASDFNLAMFWEGVTNMRTTFFAHPLRVSSTRKQRFHRHGQAK